MHSERARIQSARALINKGQKGKKRGCPKKHSSSKDAVEPPQGSEDCVIGYEVKSSAHTDKHCALAPRAH